MALERKERRGLSNKKACTGEIGDFESRVSLSASPACLDPFHLARREKTFSSSSLRIKREMLRRKRGGGGEEDGSIRHLHSASAQAKQFLLPLSLFSLQGRTLYYASSKYSFSSGGSTVAAVVLFCITFLFQIFWEMMVRQNGSLSLLAQFFLPLSRTELKQTSHFLPPPPLFRHQPSAREKQDGWARHRETGNRKRKRKNGKVPHLDRPGFCVDF